MVSKHTQGPWRWEFNEKHKNLHLVGGVPKYDLTIMDFERWGLQGATVRLRDTTYDGMNIMHKLHDRRDWITPFPGRDHHADWCSNVIHPDMRLIAAAPDLLYALRDLLNVMTSQKDGEAAAVMNAAAAIVKATGEQA